MTEKGIPERKHFTTLLDECKGDEYGFVKPDQTKAFKLPCFRNMVQAEFSGHEYLSENIYYCYCLTASKVDDPIYLSCSNAYVQLYFGLQGQLSIRDESENYFDVFPNTVQFVQYIKGEISVSSKNKEPIEVFVVNIHKSLISPEKAYFKDILSFVHFQPDKNLQTFAPIPLPIGQQMRQIIEELAQKKYSGCFLSHFIEIKILELLLLFINEWSLFHQNDHEIPFEIDDKTMKQMEQVRNLLLEDLSVTPTLKYLASAVGTNEFHLKKHFKTYFGKTVMVYIRVHKMETAKRWLVDTDRKINDIAESLGYRYATHFSAAFKKYHGKLPKDFR